MFDIPFLVPTIILVSSIIAGMVVEALARPTLRRLFVRLDDRIHAALIKELRYKPLAWIILMGLRSAILNIQLEGVRQERMQNVIAQGLLIILLMSITISIANLVDIALQAYTRRRDTPIGPSSLLANLPKIIILIVGLLVLLQSVGVQVSAVLTALGVGGLAVALALQDTLSNFFAGLYILLSRKIRPGDAIRLEGGTEGFVQDINLRHTTIRELSNNLVVIPNAKISTAINRNYNLPECDLSVMVDVGVSFGSDLDHVEEVTIDVARGVQHDVAGGVSDFAPVVRFNSFIDRGVRFTVILCARDFLHQFELKHEFIKRLHRRYNEEGIEFIALAPPPALPQSVA